MTTALTSGHSDLLELVKTGHAGCWTSIRSGASLADLMTRLIVKEADARGLEIGQTHVAVAARVGIQSLKGTSE